MYTLRAVMQLLWVPSKKQSWCTLVECPALVAVGSGGHTTARTFPQQSYINGNDHLAPVEHFTYKSSYFIFTDR
jgi:hypothetical protein